MQTIPDAVLDRIVGHRPHLAQMIANLRNHPAQAAQIEKAIATTYLLGTTHLSGPDTWHLSQVAHGGPWGGDWLTTAHAAHLSGYDEAHLRRLAGASELPAIKRGKTWYVRRDALPTKEVKEMSEETKTYIVRTKAGEEFSGYYNKANVLDTRYEDDGAVEVLEVEVPAWYASAYERGLDTEACVISYREA